MGNSFTLVRETKSIGFTVNWVGKGHQSYSTTRKARDKINSPWTASRVSWGPFRTLLGTKVKEGITTVAGTHAGRLPLTGKSKSSLQMFMTSK